MVDAERAVKRLASGKVRHSTPDQIVFNHDSRRSQSSGSQSGATLGRKRWRSDFHGGTVHPHFRQDTPMDDAQITTLSLRIDRNQKPFAAWV
ncbi:hypothetical protein [Brevundimonas variabilis]|uniref:Uncharacterized protein n=1 Tax=Brevundimonas variabilis TaxID=74312 RepID=A0A7W9CHV5_9CAUL|nr:hypothetical protein [Brevundimonas variabilis]MBB5745912.1 hypothetical protein [Brevundimonas variabilis]